jgi:hypothetical protein
VLHKSRSRRSRWLGSFQVLPLAAAKWCDTPLASGGLRTFQACMHGPSFFSYVFEQIPTLSVRVLKACYALGGELLCPMGKSAVVYA